MADLKPVTGYKTISNGVAPAISTSSDVYTSIADAHDQVVGILKFTTSVASALGLTDISSWRDIKFSAATLKLKIRWRACQDSFSIGVSGVAIPTGTSEQTMSVVTNNTYYKTGRRFTGTNAADQVITFDLLDLFNSIPDNGTVLPTTETWYIYIWSGGYSTNAKGFYRSASYQPVLVLTGRKTSNFKMYDGNEWVECNASYRDNGRWVSNVT